MNLRIGPISRLLSRGYGSCLRCQTTWRFVKGHVTDFSEHEGMFPLCEKCWADLTPKERLIYYEILWGRWNYPRPERPPEEWDAIKKAVLEGR